MKTKEELKALQAKTMAELASDLKDKKSELFNLRFQKATGQLETCAAPEAALSCARDGFPDRSLQTPVKELVSKVTSITSSADFKA